MTTYTADLTGQIQEALDKVRRGIDRLVAAVERTLSAVPDILSWVVDRFREGWDAVLAKLEEFWNWFVDKLSYVGNPFMLTGASTGWRKVGGAVVNLTRDVDDSDLLVDDTWRGKGADRYRQAVPPQREAMTSINADFANSIASGLVALAIAITAFWTGVIAAIITMVVGIATATGEAVTVLGIPLVPPTALGAIVVALGLLGAGTVTLFVAVANGRDSMLKTAAGVRTWPKFVTA